jgi:hypothetical protein
MCLPFCKKEMHDVKSIGSPTDGNWWTESGEKDEESHCGTLHTWRNLIF